MKKRVLITYFRNGDMKNEINKQFMQDAVINQFLLDGKIMVKKSETHNALKFTFSDGSTVEVMPFGKNLRGFRFTHVYMDEESMLLSSENALKPLILSNKEDDVWDFSGSQLNVYTVEDGKLKINKEEY